MKSTRRKPFAAPALSRAANAGAIEWEELPSLARRLVRGDAGDSRLHASSTFDSVWGDTQPSGLAAPAPASQPFVERVEGLATREVVEPDVFSYFFGRNAED